MRDAAYFRTTIPPEGGEGAVGWAVAEALRSHLQEAGATVGAVTKRLRTELAVARHAENE